MRHPTSWKILLLPLWILAVSLGVTILVITCATNGMPCKQCLIFGGGWLLAIAVPTVVLFHAFDKERRTRLEIERRWKTALTQQRKSGADH
jgi:hypothetical protein